MGGKEGSLPYALRIQSYERPEVMIKLKELIKLAGVELGDFKIHCATGSNPGNMFGTSEHFTFFKAQQL